MKLYEGLFLMDADAKPEPGPEEFLHGMLQQHGAKLVSTDRWGERKLAYEIGGKRRGLYFLIHFEAASPALFEIQRTCRLSEFVLRELFVVDEDGAAKAKLEALFGTPPPPAPAPAETAPSEAAHA